jgi:phytoene dehydrogenase-like protein
MVDLVGRARFPRAFADRIDGYRRDGTTLKLNMALSDLPTFRCLPERRGQHGATIHLLPEEERVLPAVREAFEDVRAGRLPELPTIEWYIHTPVDPSIQDAKGHHSSALFVQWVPYELAGTSWEAEEPRYVEHLLGLCDRFAPGTSDLVVDTFVLTPPRIEAHFGLSRGHIHHVDNSFGFADRVPYRTPIGGLYACGAGCHPGGSVIGAAGRNAARAALKDLGLGA